jgi:hypothetical protein
MMKELTVQELEGQNVELLPSRETLYLFGGTNYADIWASNTSLAMNAGSFLSTAHSAAFQSVSVYQH